MDDFLFSLGAWIVTAGTNAGVMKHVGEAVRDHTAAHGNKNKIVVLGVTPWGVLHDKEILVKSTGEVNNINILRCDHFIYDVII